MRLRLYPKRCLQEVDKLDQIRALPEDHEEGLEIRGVITHIVTDARAGEFDDTPVI